MRIEDTAIYALVDRGMESLRGQHREFIQVEERARLAALDPDPRDFEKTRLAYDAAWADWLFNNRETHIHTGAEYSDNRFCPTCEDHPLPQRIAKPNGIELVRFQLGPMYVIRREGWPGAEEGLTHISKFVADFNDDDVAFVQRKLRGDIRALEATIAHLYMVRTAARAA